MKISGLVKIEWSKDPGLTIADMVGGLHKEIPVHAVGPWYKTGYDGCSGEVTEESSVENGQTIYTVDLTFRCIQSCANFFVSTGECPSCWRFMDRTGQWRMIGTGREPYPVVTIRTDNTRSSNTESETVKVTIKDTMGLLTMKR